MQDIKEVIQNPELRNEPSWVALFDSDIKSIFPKHELTKIQYSKLRLDRYRLMMDHLDNLLYLEKHKK